MSPTPFPPFLPPVAGRRGPDSAQAASSARPWRRPSTDSCASQLDETQKGLEARHLETARPALLPFLPLRPLLLPLHWSDPRGPRGAQVIGGEGGGRGQCQHGAALLMAVLDLPSRGSPLPVLSSVRAGGPLCSWTLLMAVLDHLAVLSSVRAGGPASPFVRRPAAIVFPGGIALTAVGAWRRRGARRAALRPTGLHHG